MRRRVGLAQSLTRLSPVGLFQFAAENVAETGSANEIRFLRNIETYSKTYDRYIQKKIGKLVPFIKGYSKILENGGSGSVEGGTVGGVVGGMTTGDGKMGKSVSVVPPDPEGYQGDMSDFPWFVDTPPSLMESLKSALFDLAGLLVWNIVLTLLAFGAFLRADVR